VACGAAIKANGYGLGDSQVLAALHEAGCRDFFVSTWAEAEAVGPVPAGATLCVLHGLHAEDAHDAAASSALPVLNSVEQVQRWKALAPGRPCNVMIDTGMNRLGLRPEELACLEALPIDTLMSHLACADEDHPMNSDQLVRFREVAAQIEAKRYSLANSAAVCLGRDYSFDLVRPGIAIYGGVPRREAEGHIRQVVRLEAQVVQLRTVRAGEVCGYGATFVAVRDTRVATVNIGYADGYLRGFSSRGRAFAGDAEMRLLGRVSMDLIALDATSVDVAEGDWVEVDYHLPAASAQSGLSQYELLTGLGDRFDRRWV
jgi:alanine racemase